MTTMNRLAAALARLALAALASPAFAATTTSVVDVPFGADGDSQRFLFVAPDAPKAIVVSVPGGDGIMGIQDDGSMITTVGGCNPLGRVRLGLADRGYAVVLIDATRAGTVRNATGILEAIRWARARHAVPVWVVGGSAATAAVTSLGVSLPVEIPGGVIFNAPDRPGSQAAQIRRHAQVVYHTLDTFAFGSATFNALTNAVVRERAALSGGTNAGCGYHLFNGIDATYLDTIAAFMDKYTAATLATATPNVQGLWWKSPASSESGWGVNLTQQGDILFATWFTYDADGRGLWLVAPALVRTGSGYSGALYRTTGPAFSANPWNGGAVVATEVGTATLAFADADTGTFTYTYAGVTQSKPITRQAFATPATVCRN